MVFGVLPLTFLACRCVFSLILSVDVKTPPVEFCAQLAISRFGIIEIFRYDFQYLLSSQFGFMQLEKLWFVLVPFILRDSAVVTGSARLIFLEAAEVHYSDCGRATVSNVVVDDTSGPDMHSREVPMIVFVVLHKQEARLT